MPVVRFGSHVHCQLLHCVEGSQEYFTYANPMASSLGRAMDVAVHLLAGEQGEQCRGFCSLPVAPPRVPLRVNDWVAEVFFALTSQTMLGTAHKATYLCRFGNKRAGEACSACMVCCTLQRWSDGAQDKETG